VAAYVRRPAASRVAVLLLALAALVPSAGGTDAAGAPTKAASKADPADGLLGGFALGGDRGPVRIDAATMEFDYKTKVLSYRGGVVVTQADMTLHSETLRVILDPDHPDKPREVVAEGKVQIDKGERRATGGRAVFDNTARTVTLSDEARLRDGPNEVTGERVVVYLDEQRSVVEGGQDRVRAVLYPSSEKGGGGAVVDAHEP
jgi:lipopolysaccharide export system protein LptA